MPEESGTPSPTDRTGSAAKLSRSTVRRTTSAGVAHEMVDF